MSNSKPVYDLEERTFQFAKSIRLYISKKDFFFRLKISRKEAKESAYFLRLIYETNPTEFEAGGIELCEEAVLLKKIFSAIIEKSK